MEVTMTKLKPIPIKKRILRLLCLCFLSFPFAQAQPTSSVRIALLPAYGLGTQTRISGSNTLQPYGLGVGMRLEYILARGISIGAIFVAHRGESVNIVTPDVIPVRLETRMRYGGIEVGYLIPLTPGYAIHPRLGVGLGKPIGNFSAEAASSNDVATISTTGVRPYVSPGVGTHVEFSSQWFAGLDVRYVALADYRNANSISFFATIGFNLPIN
jgi:hypothetical protein